MVKAIGDEKLGLLFARIWVYPLSRKQTDMKIALIAAMKAEDEEIAYSLAAGYGKAIDGFEICESSANGNETVLLTSGIGKVFAGAGAEALIAHYHPDQIINFGVAGSLDEAKAPAGSLLVASSFVQHDMNTTAIGDPRGLISGINVVYFPSDEQIAKVLLGLAKQTSFVADEGIIASGDLFVAGEERSAKIAREFKAAAADMESAAIAQICYANKIPFCSLKGISDVYGDAKQYEANKSTMSHAVQELIKKYLETLR